MCLMTFQAGLQQRLNEQETLVSELKSNLLRKDFQQQNFDSEKVSFRSLENYILPSFIAVTFPMAREFCP